MQPTHTSTKCLYAPELTVHSTGSPRLACSAWPSTTECCGCGRHHMIITCQSRDCHMQPTYRLRSAGSTMSVEISASRIEIPTGIGKYGGIHLYVHYIIGIHVHCTYIVRYIVCGYQSGNTYNVTSNKQWILKYMYLMKICVQLYQMKSA